MIKVLLYGMTTFMETGLSIWMFGQMFPKRNINIKRDKQTAIWNIILIILIYLTAYSFGRVYLDNDTEIKKSVFIILTILSLICLIPETIRQVGKLRKIQGIIYFVMVSVLITCQYWTSYVSGNVIVVGNLYLPVFLKIFFQCTILDAYIWEFLYLTNMGLLKSLYIIVTCLINRRKIGEFIYFQYVHSYGSVIYLLVINLAVALLLKLFPVNKYVGNFFRNHQFTTL